MRFGPSDGKVDLAAKALATAAGVAHAAFFTIFVYRIFARGGLGAIGFALCALAAVLGLACNFVGYYLVKHGGRTRARRWGYSAIAASSALAGVLLAVAAWTAS
jgi:hypothetical protein